MLGEGLIPAHAGKTTEALRVLKPGGAHPRSRGENVHSHRLIGGAIGSSPLTRGKPVCGVRSQKCRRLIPAHAGKTVQPATAEQIDAAHPRSRGENITIMNRTIRPAGSSPLTRGKRSHGRKGRRRLRLIPAHAGKTTQDSQSGA